MENLIDIIAKILAALLAGGAAWLAMKAKEFLKTQAEATASDWVVDLVNAFCEAAEQQFKLDDPTGEKRKAYVQEMLVAAGVEVSAVVDALIESAVYRINKGV